MLCRRVKAHTVEALPGLCVHGKAVLMLHHVIYSLFIIFCGRFAGSEIDHFPLLRSALHVTLSSGFKSDLIP